MTGYRCSHRNRQQRCDCSLQRHGFARSTFLFWTWPVGFSLFLRCFPFVFLWRGRVWRLGRTLICNGCNKPVSSLGHSFDEFGFIRPVAKDFSDVQNVLSDQFWVDVGLWPQFFEKFVVGNKATWILDQVTQHVIGFRRNRHALLPSPKALIRSIKAEGMERFHLPNLTRWVPEISRLKDQLE